MGSVAASAFADAAAMRSFPFVPGSPTLPIARAEGAWLHLPDGRRVLDAAGGAIVANVGHGRREIADAVARALEQASYLVPPFASESRLALLEELRRHWLPPALSRIALVSGGSESVDAALRLARQHHVAAGRPERWKMIGRDLSYHGATLATLAVGGHDKRRAGLEPLLADWPKAPPHYCLRCPLGCTRAACDLACVDAVERLIEREGPETVAAVIAEPVVGSAAGALVPPDDYWPRLAAICRRHGVLLIADEVMSGFGRTGRAFAVDHWGVVPDILVGGKGLSGGYAPMGGVYATDAVLAPLAARGDDFMFYTYGAHPASCAAALAVLRILEREQLVARAAAAGKRLLDRLRAALAEHPHVAEVRGLGLLLGVELVRDRATNEPFPSAAKLASRVVTAGLGRGVFFYPAGAGAARDVVCLGPPFTIGDEEIELVARVLPAAIDDAVRAAG
ncbi:MAG: aspartate aminotransferase family protein [Proteobacteria bacterium]|nr:MAG: aspartate aminotransferase family protein [Pseudomonadota bacterium]